MTRPLIRLAAFLLTGLLAAPAGAQFDLPGPGGFGVDTPEVTISASASRTAAAPGSRVIVAVVLDHAPGWHSWPNAAVDLGEGFEFAIRTDITTSVDLGTPGPVQWPEVHDELVPSPTGGGPVAKPTFSGRAVAYVPVEIAGDAQPGTSATIAVTVESQSCDESMCLMPETTGFEIVIPIVALADAPDATPDPDLFGDFDPAVFAQRERWGEDAGESAPPTAPARSFFGVPVPAPDSAPGIAILALLAAAGGLILNLTPCVLPVIPIKVMTISQHGSGAEGAHKGRTLLLGLWMAAGVVGFWLALGFVAVTFTSFADPSRLFGIWWVTAFIGLAIAALGVGLLGAFNLTLPQWVYRIAPTPDTPHGSFLFGVMTAVLGLPCFGFVAGALLAGSAAMPSQVVLTIFTGIGVGMALPYLVLAAFPKLVERIPRTGPASELVKQVIGLLMLAAAMYFLGAGMLAFVGGSPDLAASLPWWGKVVHWWAIALCVVAAGVWLIWRTVKISKKPIRRIAMAALALVLSAGGVAAALDRTDHAYHDFWTPFTPEAYASARGAGQVVVLDFTAEWCLNCKALEATVLSRDPVKPELLSAGVTPLVADLTSTAAPGWDKLRDLGQTGIPLLVIDGPGLDAPWQSNAYTPEMVVDALTRARGDRKKSP